MRSRESTLALKVELLGEIKQLERRKRNLYGEDIDPRKTKTIQEAVMELFPSFVEAHTIFIAKLKAIAEALP